MTLATLPTRKLEDWRYADIDALSRIWPPEEGPERISVRAGDAQRMVITGLEPNAGVALREIEITLLPGARFSRFALVHFADYARISGQEVGCVSCGVCVCPDVLLRGYGVIF